MLLQRSEVVYHVQQEYRRLQPGSAPLAHSNFLKGIKWSPDGTCMLSASEDAWMRIYDLPQDCMTAPGMPIVLPPPEAADSAQQTDVAASYPSCTASVSDALGTALRVQEGECVYDYSWYPGMRASEPQSCCFATTSRSHPIHLWDACTGELRATYRGFNDVDEVTAAFSVAFSPDGSKLYGGYSKWMLAFDVTRPGRDCRRIACGMKGPGTYHAKLPGMVSCMAFPPDGTCMAVGTYAGMIGIYDPRIPELQLLLSGHKGGLTQLLFTHDGNFLLSGARQDPELLCWDLRGGTGGLGEGGEPYALYRMQRDTSTTNQRIGFSVEAYGRYMLTGGCGGSVRVFDLQSGDQVGDLPVSNDTVNGCDAHPFLDLLAVSTGHRRFDEDVWNNGNEHAEAMEGDQQEGGQRLGTGSQQLSVTNALRVLRLHRELPEAPPVES